MLFWLLGKVVAVAVALFAIWTAQQLARAALYPWWPKVKARVRETRLVGSITHGFEGGRQDNRSPLVTVEYEYGGKLYVKELPNSAGFRALRRGDAVWVRVFPPIPSVIWGDPCQGKPSRWAPAHYFAGVSLWALLGVGMGLLVPVLWNFTEYAGG